MSVEAPTLLLRNADVAELASRILCGVATARELERASVEEVLAIKRDTGAIHYRALTSPVTKDAKKGDRTRRFIASAESADRMGDVIRVAGWRFENFAKNPVACWGHATEKHPIGTVSDWTKGRAGDVRVLKESITYFDADVSAEAEQTMRIVDAMSALGLQPAVSVGFLPLKARMPTEDEARQYGMPGWGVMFEEQDQLELSNVTVPAHPDALLARAMEGLVKSGQVQREVADQVLASAGRYERRVFALGGVEESESDPVAELRAQVETLTARISEIEAENRSVYASCQEAIAQAKSGQSNEVDIVRRLERLEQPDGTTGSDARRIVQPTPETTAALIGEVLDRLASRLC